MTSVRMFDDPMAFERAIEPLLSADRARSTIISTVLAAVRDGVYDTTPVLAAGFEREAPIAAVLQTPPHPITVLADPRHRAAADILVDLARAVAGQGTVAEGINGPRGDVEVFATAWTAATGTRVRPGTDLLLYRLRSLVHPTTVPGQPRPADAGEPSDLALLAGWFYDFAVFTGHLPVPAGPEPDSLRRRMRAGSQVVIWERDGAPVAMAGHSVVVDGMSRIGSVYTPELLRGSGYGSAVTAAAVRSAQASGATEVVLFTDADYPTSNAIYRRLGFVEVEPFRELAILPVG